MNDEPKRPPSNTTPSATVKRSVAHPRDSAVTIRIGGEEDLGSSSSDFIKIGKGRLAVILGKGVFEVILPDDVDPARTNPAIRPANQRLLAYGSDDELVSRILLTAKALFYERHLAGIDGDAMVLLAFECVQDLVAAREVVDRLTKEQDAAEEAFRARKKTRDYCELPSVPDVQTRCEDFFSKLRHALGCLNEMVIALAGDGVKKRNWMEAVVALLEEGEIIPAEASDHWKGVVSFAGLITEARNAVEHPRDNYRLKCADYRLGLDNNVSQPTIELVHAQFAFGPASAVHGMSDMLESFVIAYEDTLAGLCALKVNAEGGKGFRRFLLELPEKERPNKFVRYGYGMQLPDGRTGVLLASG